MSNFLQNHWKKLSIAGGFTSAALFFFFRFIYMQLFFHYIFSSSIKEPETEENHDLETDPTKPKSNLRLYDKKTIEIPEFPDISAEELAKNINVQYVNGCLSYATFEEIYNNASEMRKQDYVNSVYQRRIGLFIFSIELC